MTPAQTGAHADTAEVFEEHGTAGHQSFGFWLYLMSDLVLFSAIFATFAVLSKAYAGGPTGAELFDLSFVFIETMLLLLSSAACGMAILAMHAGNNGRVLQWLALTFLLGLGFIAMELHEFQQLIAEGHGPGRSAYLSAFFTLVGTHGLHVASGLVWMAVMMYQVKTKGLAVMVQARLMRLSMFWHFLDIVWVAVFSVVYLMGVL
jgi:cytochrome o ubiquinol oxidase subunit 3